MSQSKEKHQAKLKEIYGVNFPDSLFWLHEFIVEQRNCEDPIDLSDVGLCPCGVLSLLLNNDLDSPGERLRQRVEFTGDPLLHYRYYRDVPEFFTYLSGDCDGQHWGMLLDEPTDGFRGVAMYWNNDGAEMTVYESIFDAIVVECEESIDCHEEGYLLYGEEQTTHSKQQIELCKKLKNRVEKFLAINQLSRTEGRPIGLETSTGLDLVLNKNFGCDQKDAILAPRGYANEMLKLGRELWYWNGADRSTEAYDLMRKAYELLERPELIRILDVHYHDRDRPGVDLIQLRLPLST